MGVFNREDLELLKKAGIDAECDKEYNLTERKKICMQIGEYIMNHSSKNGDINRLQKQYEKILEIIEI